MKFNTSIRSQIIFLSSGLVLVSFLALVPYMIKKFTDDKSAYLYDQILDISINSQEKTDQLMKNFEDQARILTLQNDLDQATLPSNLLNYTTFNVSSSAFAQKKTQLNPTALSKYSLDRETKDRIAPFDLNKLRKMNQNVLSDYQITSGVPIVFVYLLNKKQNELHAFKFVASEIDESYQNTKRYHNLLLSSSGAPIQNTSDLMLDPAIVSTISTNKSESGALTQSIKDETYVVGYSKHHGHDWLTITLIPQKDVFALVSKLIRKTVGFAGIVLSIAIFFGALIAKNLITPINALIQGTREITKKNYNHKIVIEGKNEFKDLSESFNRMGSEISSYIEEVKDKARIEKELEVAELVQKSFLPKADLIESDHLEIIGHLESASECGGDYWGVKIIGDQTIFYMGDATGHGVPAALITAAAHSCSALLPRIIKMNPQLVQSPGGLLEVFNDAICESGGNILMTLFLGIYDHKTHQITYANASHHTPLLYQWKDADPSKADIKPLLDAEGFRLGHKKDSVFTEAKFTLAPNDVLYIFTDGLLEAENAEKQAYGERKFIKSILANAKNGLEMQRDSILKSYNDHRGEIKSLDDVSLLLLRRK